VRILREQGNSANQLQIDARPRMASDSRHSEGSPRTQFIVENNYSGQFARIAQRKQLCAEWPHSQYEAGGGNRSCRTIVGR